MAELGMLGLRGVRGSVPTRRLDYQRGAGRAAQRQPRVVAKAAGVGGAAQGRWGDGEGRRVPAELREEQRLWGGWERKSCPRRWGNNNNKSAVYGAATKWGWPAPTRLSHLPSPHCHVLRTALSLCLFYRRRHGGSEKGPQALRARRELLGEPDGRREEVSLQRTLGPPGVGRSRGQGRR